MGGRLRDKTSLVFLVAIYGMLVSVVAMRWPLYELDFEIPPTFAWITPD